MTGAGQSLLDALGWTVQAACHGQDKTFFTGTSAAEAKRICRECPVRETCLAEATAAERGLDVNMRAGVWGGLTARERFARDEVAAARRAARARQRAGGER